MTTFWALCHAALNERRASGTCEGSAVAYVEGEATFRTLNYSLFLRHDRSLRFDFQKRDSLIALLKDRKASFPLNLLGNIEENTITYKGYS